MGSERGAQIDFETSAIIDRILHCGGEDHRTFFPSLFGLVEGYIGVTQQIVGRGPPALGNADTGRHREGNLAVGDLERGGHDVKDPICHDLDPGV